MESRNERNNMISAQHRIREKRVLRHRPSFSASLCFLLPVASICCAELSIQALENTLSGWLQGKEGIPLHSSIQSLVTLEIFDTAKTHFANDETSMVEPKRYAVLRNLTSAKGSSLNSKLVQVLALERESGRFQCRLDDSKQRSGSLRIHPSNLEMKITLADLEAPTGRTARTSLRTLLRRKIEQGISSEIVEGRLEIRHVSDDVGVGYFAAMDIRKGSILLVDSSFATATEQGDADTATSQNLLTLMRKSKQGGEVERFFNEKVLSLRSGVSSPLQDAGETVRLQETVSAEPGEEWGAGKRKQVWSILCSNQYVEEDQTNNNRVLSLFPAVSRFNHACRPNAFVDTSGQVAVVRAVAAIPQGSQVFVSYVSIMGTREERQKKLRSRGFQCRCLRCEREEMLEQQDLEFGVRWVPIMMMRDLETLEAAWGGGCPPSEQYAYMLFGMLLRVGPRKLRSDQRELFQRKLREVCQLLFGLDDMPSNAALEGEILRKQAEADARAALKLQGAS